MSQKTIGVNSAIFNERGQILLVKHTYGRKGWHLPGGGAEPDESIQDTAVRETHEETGLQVIAMSLNRLKKFGRRRRAFLEPGLGKIWLHHMKGNNREKDDCE